MCLDAHAHGMRVDHPLFHVPNEVDLTLTARPTPHQYAFFSSGAVSTATMPMWRVQTEGYLDGKDQLIGVVASNWGFLDSPDTEWISGGENSKGPDAVAIGRHGNFLHWGFAASPTYLTDEAKLVFVNAIHYIARFDGETPVALKQQHIASRELLAMLAFELTAEGREQREAYYEHVRAEMRDRNRAVRARIDAGEAVSELERQMLDRPELKTPHVLDNLRRFLSPEVVAGLGDDPTRVLEFVAQNRRYLRPGEQPYTLVVDAELAALGVGNDDMAMLERAIAGLVDPSSEERSRTLLKRYTQQSFEAQADWTRWLDDVRTDLFFSESAGYKWLVNRGAGRSSPADSSQSSDGAEMPHPDADEPLVARARAEALEQGGKLAVHVDFAVLEGWHAYRDVPAGAPYAALAVELVSPTGVTALGEWTRPDASPDPDVAGLTLLKGRFSLRRDVALGADYIPGTPLECKVSFQICDAHSCRRPTTITLPVLIPMK
jgi:hypothetical protein